MQDEKRSTEMTAMAWPSKAVDILVHDQSSYDRATQALVQIANVEKEVKAHHLELKQTAHSAHKAAIAAEKKFLDPLGKAKQIIKTEIVKYTTAQAKIKAEAERLVQEEAERVADELKIKEAEEAEAKGATETEVDAILDKPKEIVTKPVEPTFQKSSNVSTRTTWKAEVTNLYELCKAVVNGKAPLDSVSANMTALNYFARTQKDKLDIPGVKAVSDTNVAVRS